MAARTRVFKRKKPRRFSRKTQSRSNLITTRIPINPQPLAPKTVIRTLRYSEALVLDPSVSEAQYFFNANSVYDPDFTGVGHQPAGFDQLMTFYQHFEVLSSKIVWKIIPPAGVLATDQIFASVSLTDIASLNGQRDAIENGLTAWDIAAAGGGSGSNGVMTLNNTFVKKSFFGDRTGEVFLGNATQNPAEAAYYGLRISSANGGTTTSNAIRTWVEIEYTVKFNEVRQVTSS